MLVETKVGRLFARETGEGEPLLLWHSFLCDGGMWRRNIPALAEHHRVINIDGPGHGRSAPADAPFSLEDCADAVVEIMDALELERAHFAGLSWGGMTGMRVALRHPGRLRSLALLATNADRETPKKLPAYRAMAFIARRFGAVDPLIDRIIPLFFTKRSRAEDADATADFRRHLSRMQPASIGHAADAIMFDRRDIRGLLRAIDVPTLILVGREDVATPVSRSEDIAREIRGSRMMVIDQAAHLVALEQPDAVNDALLSFLASVPS